MAVTRHFWILKYKDEFHKFERDEDIMVKLPPVFVDELIRRAVGILQLSSKRNPKRVLAVFLALHFKKFDPSLCRYWIDYLPLWLIKVVSLLIACDGGWEITKRFLTGSDILKLEKDSRTVDIDSLELDFVERKYFQTLLEVEDQILGFYMKAGGGRGQVGKVFPVEFENPKKKWPEFFGYWAMGGHLSSNGGSMYVNKINPWVAVEFKNCAENLFGIELPQTNKKHPFVYLSQLVSIILERCFGAEILAAKEKIPLLFADLTREAKMRFLRAVFNDGGYSKVALTHSGRPYVCVRLSPPNTETLANIRKLLQNFVTLQPDPEGDKKSIVISRFDDVYRFSQFIGFARDSPKANRLQACISLYQKLKGQKMSKEQLHAHLREARLV